MTGWTTKLGRTRRCKSGAGKEQRPPASEDCGRKGGDHGEACTAIERGLGLSHETPKIAEADNRTGICGRLTGSPGAPASKPTNVPRHGGLVTAAPERRAPTELPVGVCRACRGNSVGAWRLRLGEGD